MKAKLFLALSVVACAVTVSLACGRADCGGGNDKCCSSGSITYYTTATPPQEV